MKIDLQFVPLIICEAGASLRLADTIKSLGCCRPLIITDAALMESGLLDNVLSSLEAAGVPATLYGGVVADPPEHVVVRAVRMAVECHADSVVGFGGGSSMDCAKLVAALANSPQDLPDLFGGGSILGPRLPLIQVPTTAGTGSEVTAVSIITAADGVKRGIVSPKLVADVAILDPELTLHLPPHVTAMVGMDAIIHAIEAFTSKVKKNPVSDSLAVAALKLLIGNVAHVVENGDSLRSRSDMLLGACLAGLAFTNAPVGAIHALAYPIGSKFGVPHGLSNALVMREVMQFNLPDATDLYASLGAAVLGLHGDQRSQAGGFVAAVSNLSARMPYAQSLSEVGIEHDDLPELAAAAMEVERLLVNNPRRPTFDDVLAIYRACL